MGYVVLSSLESGCDVDWKDYLADVYKAEERKCKDFAFYEGREIACWNFSDGMVRTGAAEWAGKNNPAAMEPEKCWLDGATATMAVDALTDGQTKKTNIACPLVLTAIPDVKTRDRVPSIDATLYGSVTVAAKYELDGKTFVYGDLMLRATGTADSVRSILPFMKTAPGSVTGFVSVPIPVSPGDLYKNLGVELTFNRADPTQHIKLHSVIVLGVLKQQ
jgi:hypothetical protein